jgi:hypothetical protein
MISARIKEVKNNLSRLLIRVKRGEEVLITDRGRPISPYRAGKTGKQIHPCSIWISCSERIDRFTEPKYLKRKYHAGQNHGAICFRNGG